MSGFPTAEGRRRRSSMRQIFAIGIVLLDAVIVGVQAQTASATLSVDFGSQARISLSTTSLVFADADPDLVPHVASSPDVVAITAKARAPRNAQITLTVQSTDDLRSGVTVLPASLITWTASGPGFVAGTLDRSAATLVGAWTGSGIRSGTQTYVFENRWTHPPGVYSVTLFYTVSSP